MAPQNNHELLAEIAELRARLEEAEEPLRAIRNGEVDALVVSTPEGDRVFTLKGAETPYRLIVESINEGAATLTKEGVFLYANNCLAEMLGVPQQKIMGASLFDLTLDTDHELLGKILALGRRENARGEISLISGGKAVLPVRISLRSLPREQTPDLSVVITDISGQKLAAEILEKKVRERTAELQKAKEINEYQLAQLNGIINQMTEGLVIFDPQGNLLSMNPMALEIHDFSSMEHLQSHLHELADIIEVFNMQGRLLSLEEWPISLALKGETVKSAIIRIRRRDTGRSWYSSCGAAPIFDQQGRMLLAVLTLSDITSLKMAEEEREHLIKELEQAIQELEGFTYSVSHDLRAPIRHLSSYITLLRDKIEPGLDQRGREYLRIIINGSQKLGILVDELLEFSRMGRTQLSKNWIDLNGSVRDIVRNFEQENTERHIEWRVATLPAVFGDQALLQLVFGNLIANAVKFTSQQPKAVIEIGSAENGESYTIYVKDNGIGFDMKYYDKLFGVFHRLHTSEEFEGTGIGLANVQRIIQRHGGRVWAVAKVNEGATFYISLPKK